MKTKRILIATVAVIVFTCGLTALKNDDKSFEISKHLNIYATLFRDVNMFYVDEITPGDLVTTSIKAMLKSLDPYTVYYPAIRNGRCKINDYRIIRRDWFCH
ncbi:MAG: hypothetical protein V8S95_09070 [Odoribacter sp.]